MAILSLLLMKTGSQITEHNAKIFYMSKNWIVSYESANFLSKNSINNAHTFYNY